MIHRSFRSSFHLLIHSISLIYISLTFFVFHTSAVTHPQEVAALTELFHAWSDNQQIGWNLATDPCSNSWLGISCDSTIDPQYSRVTSLLLVNQGLKGTLPAAVGNLTQLIYLDLSSNPSLGGSLPSSLGQLSNLQRLYLQSCNFSGGIPSQIGLISKLEYLVLNNNSLTGPIPDTVGNLSSMFWFDTSYNLLSGSLPVSDSSPNGIGLDNLTKAQHIHIQGNQFSGTIPASLFQPYMQLLHLLLAENRFTGSIPSNINDLQKLDIIRLDNNNLTGAIPSTLSTITNLTTLQLNNNDLSGEIPSFSNNKKLEILMLQSNSLNGTFNLTGEDPSVLTYIDVSNNGIQNLDLGEYATANGDSVTFLMYKNPYCSSGNNNASIVDCDEPSATQTYSSTVNVLGCSTCKGSPIERVNPNDINDCQCTLPIMVTWSFYAIKRNLTTLQTSDIESLRQAFLVMWGASQFTKTLQPPLQLNQIDIQVTAYNALNISIFPAVGDSAWDASDATIISYVLQNQDIWFSTIGPMLTIFWTGPYQYPGGIPNGLTIGAKIGIGVGVFVLCIALVLVGVYAINQRKRALQAEKLAKPFSSWITSGKGHAEANIPVLKGARWFSFREILNYTNNFHVDNEIGSGGYGKVYKGYLPSKDVVAIKRSSAASLQGVTEFKNEIELLSRVHHRNLVGLIGFCFEDGEQILVYKYMPNGTLRECLKDPTKIDLTWNKRIDLALHAAKGIAYLHYEADPPIIHRDIKSNNILLDEELVAMVADFGLSKLSPKDGDDENMESMNVKGTIGYLDPSYYMTSQLTNKSDVYSFGVVLFELITGRPPIEGGKYVVSEVRTAFLKGGLAQVISRNLLDPTLVVYPFNYLQQLIRLAMNCVNDDPEKRPTMTRVVKELEDLQLYSQYPGASLGNKEYASLSMDCDLSDGNDEGGAKMATRGAMLYGIDSPYVKGNDESSSFANSVNCEVMFKQVDPK